MERNNRKLVKTYTKKDFRVDTFRGSGPGGQHRNKVETAVRITHIPSGLSSTSTVHKSQYQNKVEAFRKLANLIVNTFHNDKVEHERSDKVIRSYSEKTDTVTDHVTGEKYSYKHTIGKTWPEWLNRRSI